MAEGDATDVPVGEGRLIPGARPQPASRIAATRKPRIGGVISSCDQETRELHLGVRSFAARAALRSGIAQFRGLG